MARPVPSPPKRWGRACTFGPAWCEKGVYGRYARIPKHTTPRFEDRSRAHEPGTAPPLRGGPEVASVGRSATTASFEGVRVTDPERGESHPRQDLVRGGRMSRRPHSKTNRFDRCHEHVTR